MKKSQRYAEDLAYNERIRTAKMEMSVDRPQL